jgi:hypothetical protein
MNLPSGHTNVEIGLKDLTVNVTGTVDGRHLKIEEGEISNRKDRKNDVWEGPFKYKAK